MSLTTRPKRGHNGDAIAGDAAPGLNVTYPTTPRQWEDWQRKRARYRLALARWAIEKARTDPGFDAEQELKAALALLELTPADDERLMAANRAKGRAFNQRGMAPTKGGRKTC